ncbi:hypothetical protein ABNB80_20495, partial [Paenibacillus larvae]
MTTKGRNLQAKAQTGVELKYTRVGIGDGQLAGQSIMTLNKLINEKKSLPITKLNIQTAGKAVIGTVLSNQEVTTGFYFREIEYIPPAGGADIVEKSIDVIVIVGNAQNVTAEIESSLIPVNSVNGKTGDVVLAAADIQTGSGKDVETTISELFTSVSDGKDKVAKAITDQGVPAVKEDTFTDLATKIKQINTGKKWAEGTIPRRNLDYGETYYLDINELNFKPKLILIEYREMELDVISDDKYTFMMYSENMLGEFTREIMNTSKVLHWASLYGGFTGRLKDHVYHIKETKKPILEEIQTMTPEKQQVKEVEDALLLASDKEAG